MKINDNKHENKFPLATLNDLKHLIKLKENEKSLENPTKK